MFRSGDWIEATVAHDIDQGHFDIGDRADVADVSASGLFIRLKGSDAFYVASGWRRMAAH